MVGVERGKNTLCQTRAPHRVHQAAANVDRAAALYERPDRRRHIVRRDAHPPCERRGGKSLRAGFRDHQCLCFGFCIGLTAQRCKERRESL